MSVLPLLERRLSGLVVRGDLIVIMAITDILFPEFVLAAEDLDGVFLACWALGIDSEVDISEGALAQEFGQLVLVYLLVAVHRYA